MALEIATFTTSHGALRLVRQPGIPAYNAMGRRQGFLQKSVVYQFEELGHRLGKLTLKKGQDLLQDGPFDEEKGEPTWQDALDWIRQQPSYGQVNRVDGFVEDGREPGRVPDPKDELDDISEAGVTLDPDKLRAILAAERETWNREQVITLAERTLERVEKAIAAQEKAKPPGKAPAKA